MGSIQQLLVEWEVVPIGDSSLEESPHEASNSVSSFFERLMGSSHVGEGSSQPCEGVKPFTTPLEEELIHVTPLLPSSSLVTTRRNGGGEVRVSARNKCRRGDEMPSSFAFVVGFE